MSPYASKFNAPSVHVSEEFLRSTFRGLGVQMYRWMLIRAFLSWPLTIEDIFINEFLKRLRLRPPQSDVLRLVLLGLVLAGVRSTSARPRFGVAQRGEIYSFRSCCVAIESLDSVRNPLLHFPYRLEFR